MECAPQTKSQWIGFAAFWAVHLLSDFWLGKTKKTEANSIAELLVISARVMVALLFKKKEKK